jgi:hypothetical protein
VLAKNAESGHNFTDIVESISRDIQWIDPSIKRLLEAIWKVANEGRDKEIADAVDELEVVEQMQLFKPKAPDPTPSDESDTEPAPRPIQTMQAGNSGIGSGGFDVSKSA